MTRRLSTFRPVAQGSSNRRRGGFSLIELLIVITVIAILVSLLLVGVQGAMGRVRVTAVVAELKNFEKAVKDFKSDFGVEPPSFIKLHEAGTGWAATDADTRASRAFLRQLWKDFDFTTMGDSGSLAVSAVNPVANNGALDLNGDGDETDTLYLSGAECLVFFLGGMADKSSGTVVMKGFSKISSAPFSTVTGAGGSRSGPYYEFDSKHLVVVDDDKMYGYLDSIPGQQRVIQYFSSYDGTGYRPLGRNGVYDGTSGSDDEVLPNTLRWVYTKSAGTSSPLKAAEPFNPNGFQLISAGLNSEYCGTLASGTTYEGGGFMDSENGVQTGQTVVSMLPSPAGTIINRDAQSAVLERDNITNFQGGEIH